MFNNGANIVEAEQFNDEDSSKFFMRVSVEIPVAGVNDFNSAFGKVVEKYNAEWWFRPRTDRKKVVIMVSKFDHCLGDLLYRHRLGELDMKLSVSSQITLERRSASVWWGIFRSTICLLHLRPRLPKSRKLRISLLKAKRT